ncbi:MAG: S4 domain-containing protein [Gammaproteobacteria bacterium]|nr:S4 domain-containing protein [Gammaproteobacteria bacterium]
MVKQRLDAEQLLQVRIDKWLWAARFFKTRSLASEAIKGGKVHINGQKSKPAKMVQMGDELKIRRGFDEYWIAVRQLSAKRGSAKVAVLLYEESAESLSRRQTAAEQRKVLAVGRGLNEKPNKKQRRQLVSFTKGRL